MYIYQPYFYIIQHKSSGKYYAGCKYAQDANPSKFMIEGGYITSSPIIKKIIEDQGLSSFDIKKIRVFETPDETREYETRYLQKVNARNNIRFYNTHNNDGYMDRTKQKEYFQQRYMVDSPFESEELRVKSQNTLMKNYGVEYPMQSEIIKKRFIDTNINRYGVPYPMMNENIKNKQRLTNEQLYGVQNQFQRFEVKETTKATNKTRYGNEFPQRTQNIKDRTKNTNIMRYNHEYPMMDTNTKQKQSLTNRQMYGVSNAFQIKEVKERNAAIRKERADRKCLKDYYTLCEKYGIPKGRGIYLKQDIDILEMIDNIVSKYKHIWDQK